MIIFNGQELKSPFTKTEKRVININSVLSFEDVMNHLLNKEPFPEGKVSIANYEYSEDEPQFYDAAAPSEHQADDLFYDILDYTRKNATEFYGEDGFVPQDHIDALFQKDYTRPNDFKTFEKYQFGQAVLTPYKLVTELSDDDLLKEFKMAIGTPPTLMDANLTYEELRKYNSLTAQLMVPSWNPSKENPYPTIQELDHFASMNDYERRLITDGYVHPYRAFKMAEYLKSHISPNYLFTTEDYDKLKADAKGDIEILSQRDSLSISDEQKTKAERLFRENFHNFVPQVYKEYLVARAIRDGGYEGYSKMLDRNMEKYVKEFNRKNITPPVAKSKSLPLIGYITDINFNNLPKKLTEIIGTYVTFNDLHDLEKKGFPEYLNTHQDITPQQLHQLITYHEKIQKFDKEKDPVQLIMEVKNYAGYQDYLIFRGELQSRKNDALGNYCGQIIKLSHPLSTYLINGKPMEISDNLIAIKGRHTVAKQGQYVMRMLPPDDFSNFTVGYDTTCCQHAGNAGEACTFKAVTDPFAGIVVMEKAGKVKAQAFVWTDEMKDTFVFDNVEFAGNDSLDNILSAEIKDLMQQWIEAIPYKNVHIGTGCNGSMRGWGRPIKEEEFATLPTTIKGNHTYSDYHAANARCIKRDGEMVMKLSDPEAHIEITTKPDEPTKWDKLAEPGLNFLLNDYNKTFEEKMAFAERLSGNLGLREQMEVVSVNPRSIALIEHPEPDVQRFILEHHPGLIEFIQNPIPEILYHNLSKNPEKIFEVEDPTPEAINVALSANGMLISRFAEITDEMIWSAIRQTPKAASVVPRNRLTLDMERYIVSQDPAVVLSYMDPSREVLVTAIAQKPALISKINNPSYDMKLDVIRQNPNLILDIKNPRQENETPEEHNQMVKNLWTAAVEGNGYLIRNCGRSFPDLRMTALRQTPFAIVCLKDVTREELEYVTSADPKAYMFIQDPILRQEGQRLTEQHFGEAIPKRNYLTPASPIYTNYRQEEPSLEA